MKMNFKKGISVIICLCMVLALMPFGAFAEEPMIDVSTSGINLSDYDFKDGGTFKAGTGTVTWVPQTDEESNIIGGTLTLNGAQIIADCYYAISFPPIENADYKLVLEGENTVNTVFSSNSDNNAVLVNKGNLSISGSGSLGIDAYVSTDGYVNTQAISVNGNLSVSSDVDCYAHNASDCGSLKGIRVEGSLTIAEGCTVKAKTGTSEYGNFGVYVGNNILLNKNSVLEASGGKCTSGDSYGIYMATFDDKAHSATLCDGARLTASSADVTNEQYHEDSIAFCGFNSTINCGKNTVLSAIAGNSVNGNSTGIVSHSLISDEGSVITATGKEAKYTYGISCYDNELKSSGDAQAVIGNGIIFNKSTVTATAGTAETFSAGIKMGGYISNIDSVPSLDIYGGKSVFEGENAAVLCYNSDINLFSVSTTTTPENGVLRINNEGDLLESFTADDELKLDSDNYIVLNACTKTVFEDNGLGYITVEQTEGSLTSKNTASTAAFTITAVNIAPTSYETVWCDSYGNGKPDGLTLKLNDAGTQFIASITDKTEPGQYKFYIKAVTSSGTFQSNYVYITVNGVPQPLVPTDFRVTQNDSKYVVVKATSPIDGLDLVYGVSGDKDAEPDYWSYERRLYLSNYETVYLYARTAGTDYYAEGAVTAPIVLTATSSEELFDYDVITSVTDTAVMINNPVDGYEYMINKLDMYSAEYSATKTDTGSDVTSLTFDGLTPKTDYRVMCRIQATENTLPSDWEHLTDVCTSYSKPVPGEGYTIDENCKLTLIENYSVNASEDFTGTDIPDGSVLENGKTYYIRFFDADFSSIPASAATAFTAVSVTVSDLSINGTKNSPIAEVSDVSLSLNGAVFDGVTIGSSFKTNFDGIKANVTAISKSNNSVIVTLSGTPSVSGKKSLFITIPSENIKIGDSHPTTDAVNAENEKATVGIKEDGILTRHNYLSFTSVGLSYYDCYGEIKYVNLEGKINITDTGEGWNWYSDGTTVGDETYTNSVLILDKADIVASGSPVVSLPEDTTVIVRGESSITADFNKSSSDGMIEVLDCEGNLTIKGEKLNITADGLSEDDIYTNHFKSISSNGTVTLDSCNLKIFNENGRGIYSDEAFTIKDSTLTAECYSNCCLESNSDIIINNSKLNLKSDSITIASESTVAVTDGSDVTAVVTGDTYNSNILADDDLTVSDSTVSTVGGYDGMAIADGTLTVTNSTVNCKPNDDKPNKTLAGISAEGKGSIVITNSNVTANGSVAGISSKGTITIDGGTLNAATTAQGSSNKYIPTIAAVYAAKGITIANTVAVNRPLGGKLNAEKTMVCESDGTTAAKTVNIGKPEYKAEIINIPESETKTVNYGDGIELSVNTSSLPAGAQIVWYDGDTQIGTGEKLTYNNLKSTAVITAKIFDADGNALKDADGKEIVMTETISVKTGFWQKLISFFKNLFKMDRLIKQ